MQGAYCLLALVVLALASVACNAQATLPLSTPTLAATATPAPTATPTATPLPPSGMLYVDAGRLQGEISPLVYGTNYGPWLFVPLQMQDAAKAAQLKLVRFPGGNWGDQNDLDAWQIDQYMTFVRQWGSEPFINVRLRDSTPEKAAALVRLVNVEKGYNVRYWGIGNEPNYFETDTVSYNQRWRQWAEAMRAVDPNILLVGPETDRFHPDKESWPKDAAGRDWLVEFLKANGDLVDIVAVHRYPFPLNRGSGAPSIEDLRQSSKDWDAVAANLHSLVKEYTGRDLPVGFTEINSSWAANSGSEGSMDSHYNAIWWADSLGRLIRGRAMMVAQFCIIGEFGLMGKYEVYPIYGVYEIYQHFGNELVYAYSDNPTLTVYAARREDAAAGSILSLVVVNLGDAEQSYPLRIDSFTASGAASAWQLNASSPQIAAVAAPELSKNSLTVPGQSVTVIEIPGK